MLDVGEAEASAHESVAFVFYQDRAVEMQHIDAGLEVLLKAIASLIGANPAWIEDCKYCGEHNCVLKQFPHLNSSVLAMTALG